jgi:trehalose-6-phosphate synthase
VGSLQPLTQDEFYALLSVADLGLITPLREGMNVSSMLFVVAQEKTNKSPIVLSEFTGFSEQMEGALRVNPFNLGVCIFTSNLTVVTTEPLTLVNAGNGLCD